MTVRVFIAHEQADEACVHALVATLRAAGFVTWPASEAVFTAVHHAAIRDELNAADLVLAVWSAASRSSAWVMLETREGARRAPVIHVALDALGAPAGAPPGPLVSANSAEALFEAGLLARIVELVGEPGDVGDQRVDEPERGTFTARAVELEAGGSWTQRNGAAPERPQGRGRSLNANWMGQAQRVFRRLDSRFWRFGAGVAVAGAGVAIVLVLAQAPPRPRSWTELAEPASRREPAAAPSALAATLTGRDLPALRAVLTEARDGLVRAQALQRLLELEEEAWQAAESATGPSEALSLLAAYSEDFPTGIYRPRAAARLEALNTTLQAAWRAGVSLGGLEGEYAPSRLESLEAFAIHALGAEEALPPDWPEQLAARGSVPEPSTSAQPQITVGTPTPARADEATPAADKTVGRAGPPPRASSGPPASGAALKEGPLTVVSGSPTPGSARVPSLASSDRAPTTPAPTPAPTPTPASPEAAASVAGVQAGAPTRQLNRTGGELAPATLAPPEAHALEPARPAARPYASRTVAHFDCATCPPLVRIEPAEFVMGDHTGAGAPDEKPLRRVTFRRPIFLGQREVTFAEWDACVDAGGCDHSPDDNGWGRADRPVINVSWADAQAYVAWLARSTRLSYRLPSEAEWEYAARAGSSRDYPFGDSPDGLCQFANGADASSDYSWRNQACEDGYARQTAPTASFRPNRLGLHDMQGNVWEWVEDCWRDSYEGAPLDGSALTAGCSGSNRVLRGGSFSVQAEYLRPAYRYNYEPRARLPFFGFRVARDLSATEVEELIAARRPD